MFTIGDKVVHKTDRRLDDGYVKSVSKSGKKVTVTWGIEETMYNYEGTVYFASSLEYNQEGSKK